MQKTKRFGKYVILSAVIFPLEVGFLFLITEYFHIHYVIATVVAFVSAVTLHYFAATRWIFHGSTRALGTGYVYYLGIAACGLAFVSLLMYVCVEVLTLNYVLSRIIVGAVVGMWGYLMNVFLNFQVHHHPQT